jgi:hypothetical protein
MEMSVRDVTVQQSVVIDPSTIQHLEMVWFEPRGNGSLLPRAARLAGFDLEQPRVSLTSLVAAGADRCNAYLERRGAKIREHGALSEVVFETVATMYGVLAPDLLCLSAWPDERSLESFMSAADTIALRAEAGIADVAFTSGRLERTFHASDQAFTMRFDAGCVYELCALWVRDACSPEDRQAFFDSVAPSLARHGAGPGMVIAPTHGEYVPNMLCFSEWPSLEHFAAFIADADHVEVSRKRFVAFSRMDATATRLYTGRAEALLDDQIALRTGMEGERENA